MTNGRQIRKPAHERRLKRQRLGILRQFEGWLEKPMILLGFAWLALLVLEFTRGLDRWLQRASTLIWIVFVLEFLVRFWIAPGKVRFLRKNWLTIIALVVPALRVFRIVQAFRFLRLARATRGLRLVRVVTSINRGMSSLGSTLQKSKFAYVVGLSVLVTFAGAAGMHAFERPASGSGPFHSYANSLWWTAMMMTTMGSDFWPSTPEGRMLCLLLAFYAFAIWGYVTATLATFFLGGWRTGQESTAAIARLRAEIAALREELRTTRESSHPAEQPGKGQPPQPPGI